MKTYIKNLVFTLITKHLFKIITQDDFLTVDKQGIIWHKGNALSVAQRQGLIKMANEIRNNELFTLLMKEMTFVANKEIYFNSKTISDVLGGKMCLWTLDVLTKKIENLSNLK